jgi:low affinity Fe/Cu permease
VLDERGQPTGERHDMAEPNGVSAEQLPIRRSRFLVINRPLERMAVLTTNWVGSSWAFLIAVVLTATWLVSGPFFGYSNTWQLVMNTISSIVTFLMVFLLQRSQNKESLAMQVKLNELLAAVKGASNRLINVEDLSEEEVRDLHDRYQRLIQRSCGGNPRGQCSIEDAERQQARAEQETRSDG